MLKPLGMRVLAALATLLFASLLMFAATEILPGDVAQAILGQYATPEALAAMRDRLGLDQPAYIRYVEWLGRMLVGDLGQSTSTGQPVATLIEDRLRNTLLLAFSTALVAVPLALALGLVAATHANSAVDHSITIAALIAVAVPGFFTAILLIYLFSVSLEWLPSISMIRSGQTLSDTLDQLILPVAVLTLVVMAHTVRLTRNSLVNVLSSGFIETAILKGIPRNRIILFHALPNVLSPIFTIVALTLAYLVSGVVIVETVFSYPGLGRLMVDAVAGRDIPLIQACGMIFCLVYLLLNMTADVLSALANPRLRAPR